MSLSRSEQETIITRAADQRFWHVFSEDPSVVRKMTRLYGEGRKVGEGAEWEIPKAGVSLRRPRVLSNEQKVQMAKRTQESKPWLQRA